MANSKGAPPRTTRIYNNPYGRALSKAKRDLVDACRAAASDDEVAEWLVTIWRDRRWPARRSKIESPFEKMEVAPSEATIMAAMKMFLERRDGMPSQAVHIKAELDARARVVHDIGDAVDLDMIDGVAGAALEAALSKLFPPTTETRMLSTGTQTEPVEPVSDGDE